MRRIVLIVLGVLAISTNAFAQTAADTIERALPDLPAEARDGATVIKWNPDFTYETLKEGTNSWVCFELPPQGPYTVQCSSGSSLKFTAQFLRFLAESGGNSEEFVALQDAAEADGSLVPAEHGSVIRLVRRHAQARGQVHTIISMPGATTESLGLPDNPDQGIAWIMYAGTPGAHIMIPAH